MAAAVKAAGVVSKKSYAEHRGCSQAYISKLIRQGKLAAPALLDNGKVNVALADQMLGPPGEAESLLPEPVPRTGPVFAAERALREKAERELKEMELARQLGQLLPADEVARAQFEVTRRIRDAILAVPDAVAADLAAAGSEHQVAALLRAALVKVLESVAGGLEIDAGDGDDGQG